MKIKYTMLVLMALMAAPMGISGLTDEKKNELVNLLTIDVDKGALKDILAKFIALAESNQEEREMLKTLILTSNDPAETVRAYYRLLADPVPVLRKRTRNEQQIKQTDTQTNKRQKIDEHFEISDQKQEIEDPREEQKDEEFLLSIRQTQKSKIDARGTAQQEIKNKKQDRDDLDKENIFNVTAQLTQREIKEFLQDIENMLNEENHKIENLENHKKKIQNSLEKYREELETIQQEKDVKKYELSTLEKEIDRLNAEKGTAKFEVDKSIQLLEETNSRLAEFRKIHERENNMRSKEKKIEIDKLVTELIKTNKNVASINDEIKDLIEKRDHLRKQVKNLEEKK